MGAVLSKIAYNTHNSGRHHAKVSSADNWLYSALLELDADQWKPTPTSFVKVTGNRSTTRSTTVLDDDDNQNQVLDRARANLQSMEEFNSIKSDNSSRNSIKSNNSTNGQKFIQSMDSKFVSRDSKFKTVDLENEIQNTAKESKCKKFWGGVRAVAKGAKAAGKKVGKSIAKGAKSAAKGAVKALHGVAVGIGVGRAQ